MALSKIQTTEMLDAPNLGRRNLIINGAMQVAQRGTSHTTSVNTGYHTVDRIYIGGSSNVGQWTTSQDSDAPDGFTKSFKIECTTADTSLASTDHYGIMYIPEGHHMNPVGKGTSGAKSMTLSFYMKANVSKTMVVELTDAGNARHVNFAVTPSATNTWERITLSIPADTSGSFNQGTNSKAAELNFWLASGTNYNTGSLQSTWTARTAANIVAGVSNWADTVGNTLWITGLQLEVGETATPFEHQSFGDELQRCMRYYEKGYDYDTAPGTAAAYPSNLPFTVRGMDEETSGQRYMVFNLKSEKRAIPTNTYYDEQGNTGKVTTYDSVGTGTHNVSVGLVVTQRSKYGCGPGNSAIWGYGFFYECDAEL